MRKWPLLKVGNPSALMQTTNTLSTVSSGVANYRGFRIVFTMTGWVALG